MGEYSESDREILLALLRGEKITNLPPDAWQQVVNLSLCHDVSAYLYQQLTRLEETIASARLQELHKAYLMNAARNTFFYHELARALEALHQAHIPVIVLKGAFLAERVYPTIAARHMGDIDLLVRDDDLTKVDGLLISLGFHRQFLRLETSAEAHALPYKDVQTGLVIEVHWTLLDARHGMQVDIEQLWQRAQPAVIAQKPALEITPEDQILHLCIHAAIHAFEMGLRPLCDLDRTIRHYQNSIDWGTLRQRTLNWRAERSVYLTLRLANDLLHTPTNPEWMSLIQPEEFEEAYYQLARQHLFQSVEQPESALPDAAGLVRFWTAENIGRKLGILMHRIFPTREEMARMYPAPAHSLMIFLYYPARIIDLLHRFGQIGIHLLLGKKRISARAEYQKQVNNLRDWMISRRE